VSSLDVPPPSPDVAHHRARVAGLKQNRPPEDPAIAEAERDLRAAKLADHVRKIVEQWPPLTDAQRTRVAALLAPTTQTGAAS
jgi:hypothetical protein